MVYPSISLLAYFSCVIAKTGSSMEIKCQWLTLPMLRLISSKALGCKHFCKPFKPCHVGIHWIVLPEYSQMSTHLLAFHSFFRVFFASFSIGQISQRQHKISDLNGKTYHIEKVQYRIVTFKI